MSAWSQPHFALHAVAAMAVVVLPALSATLASAQPPRDAAAPGQHQDEADQQDAEPGLGGLLTAPSSARGGEPELQQLAAELDALGRRSDARAAELALALGRQALTAVAEARARGQRARAARKLQIAWAALALAQRQVSLAEARRQLELARQRSRQAASRLSRAREAMQRVHRDLKTVESTP